MQPPDRAGVYPRMIRWFAVSAWVLVSGGCVHRAPVHDAVAAAPVDFARRRSLTTLDLSVTDVTNPAPLASLPNLRVLGLAQDRLSREGVAAARALDHAGVQVFR